MIRNQTPRIKTAIAVSVATVPAVLVATLLPLLGRRELHRHIDPLLILFVRGELFFTTFNFILLLGLLYSYLMIHRDLRNKYTLSMLILAGALLLYAFTSNPLVHILFGLRPEPNIGAFAFLPDIFIGAAIVVLLYQSQA